MDPSRYVTLGRSGLRVSPISLGAMTFGTEYGWGADQAAARALFDTYIAAGGNSSTPRSSTPAAPASAGSASS